MVYQQIYFSQFFRLECPKSGCGQKWCLIRAHFLDLHVFTVTSCGGRASWLCRVSSMRVLIAIARALPSWTNDLPKAPPPKTITLGVRTSIYEFWRDVNIQTIAISQFIKHSYSVPLYTKRKCFRMQREQEERTYLVPTHTPLPLSSLDSLSGHSSTKAKRSKCGQSK